MPDNSIESRGYAHLPGGHQESWADAFAPVSAGASAVGVLACRLIGKGVDDAEGRRAEPNREPWPGVRFLFDKR